MSLSRALGWIAVVSLALVGCASEESGESHEASRAELERAHVETWAFCGVDPHDRNALRAAKNMASVAGIDATMGPCRPAPPGYTAANPGARYVSPEDYLAVAWINAAAGMKTVVYDARLWNDDPNVRRAGVDFWRSHLDWVRAWDMGDEFDPNKPGEWATLVHRWKIMIDSTLPETGIGPYTNHLGNAPTLERALTDLPLAGVHLSFDLYEIDAAVRLAASFHGRVSHLMCAANALRFDAAHVPTAGTLKGDIQKLRFAGCGSILVFGGAPVVGGAAQFGTSSLVDAKGNPTPLASAVRAGLR